MIRYYPHPGITRGHDDWIDDGIPGNMADCPSMVQWADDMIRRGPYACTLPNGHADDHAAGIGSGIIVARWTDADQVQP